MFNVYARCTLCAARKLDKHCCEKWSNHSCFYGCEKHDILDLPAAKKDPYSKAGKVVNPATKRGLKQLKRYLKKVPEQGVGRVEFRGRFCNGRAAEDRALDPAEKIVYERIARNFGMLEQFVDLYEALKKLEGSPKVSDGEEGKKDGEKLIYSQL